VEDRAPTGSNLYLRWPDFGLGDDRVVHGLRGRGSDLPARHLEALAKELERTHPGAAGSLREGLSETLTVLRLAVPPTLARTLRSTNSIESICRNHSSNVKNWQNGNMALRWCAAGMVEAGKQFRRVNGHLHLPALRIALDQRRRRANCRCRQS